jgi:hypothetical protein
MWTVQGELDAALAQLALTEKQILRLDETKAKDIIRKIREIYVSGNPRAWWLALKLPFDSFSHEYASAHLDEYLSLQSDCYWIPETGHDDFPVYVTTMETIMTVMAKCAHFEYYVSDMKFEKLLIANDHGEIIVTSRKQTSA